MPEYKNIAARISLEQHQQLLEVAHDRDVSISEVIRDAVNHYLGGERGDLLTGPEAGFLNGRATALRAISHYLATTIPAGEDFPPWAEQMSANRAAGNGRR